MLESLPSDPFQRGERVSVPSIWREGAIVPIQGMSFEGGIEFLPWGEGFESFP